jgi:integrase
MEHLNFSSEGEVSVMSCRVIRKRNQLVYRLYFDNRQHEQTTAWRDTASNRKIADGRAQEMSNEIKAGSFKYEEWFPNGRLTKNVVLPQAAKVLTLREYYDERWVKRQVVPFVRKGQARDYRQHFNAYVSDFLGDRPIDSVGAKDLIQLRHYLIKLRKISMKTAKNVMAGSLAAIFRDAKWIDKVINLNPFSELPPKFWPPIERQKINPFTDQERDRIILYYLRNRSLREYVFVHFRFWSGTRPSEAVALKWGCVDLERCTAEIILSRYLGDENKTKTRASERTIELLPEVVENLKKIKPENVDPDEHVFLNSQERVLRQEEFTKTSFNAVLQALKIKRKPFYNLRHTCISTDLAQSTNPQWICDRTGTSLEMIKKSYGKYSRSDGGEKIAAYARENARYLEEHAEEILSQKPDFMPNRGTLEK